MNIPGLKSADIVEYAFIPNVYEILVRHQIKIGEMLVSNNDESLIIEIVPDQNTYINNVQLWAGASLKKVNQKTESLPLPLKSGGYNISSGSLNFSIPINKMYNKNPEVNCESKELYLIAHFNANIATSAGMEEVSAWLQGSAIGNSQNVTYSIYTTHCLSTGGGGCFQHTALGGNFNLNGVYYYDNVTGGQQKFMPIMALLPVL